VFYESPPRYLDRTLVRLQTQESQRSVREIVELVLEWLTPVMDPEALYSLLE